MPQSGTYTAYRQLKPLEGDVSQDIQQQEENGFRRRTLKLAEDKAEQDIIRTQKEDEEKQISRAASRVKGMGLWDMSSSSGNDVIRKGLAIATEEIGKWSIIRDNPKSTLAQRIEAESKIDALQKFPDNAKVVTDALKGEWDEYKKMVLTGKWRRDPGYEERYQNGYKDIQMSVDDNMQPVVIYGGKLIDRNGDGQINNFDADSLETLKDVSKRPQFKTIYNEGDMIKEDLLKVKPFKNTDTNGVQEVTTTGIEPEVLQSVVNSRFFKKDGSATPELESLAIDRNINLTDKAGIDEIISDYKNKIIFGTPRGVEKKDLYNKLDLQKEARLRAESKEPKEDASKVLGAENINQVGIVKGNQTIKGTAIEKANGAKVYSVEGTNLERAIGTKGAYERVQNIYVMPNGRDIVLDVDKVDGTVGGDGEAKTSNTVKVSYSSNKDAQIIADFVTKKINPKTGKLYKSTEEFMEDSFGIKQNKAEDTNSSSSSNKITKGQKVDGYQFLGGDPNDPKSWKKI